MKSAIALTFHGVITKTDLRNPRIDPTSDRYLLDKELFQKMINTMSLERVCTVSEYIDKRDDNWLILTFDDGNISDFKITFPILREKNIKATFFVNPSNIDSSGYLTRSHLLEMTEAGMEIGSHGLDHRYLVSINSSEAVREIRESKERLEEILCKKVFSFAPPGGHYKKWMLPIAREAGYRIFATMIPGETKGEDNFLILKRNHLQSFHDTVYLSRLIDGNMITMGWARLNYQILHSLKKILGLQTYERLKNIIMRALT